jgi:lipoprotein NlpI
LLNAYVNSLANLNRMSWNWLASLRVYLPSLPKADHDFFPAYRKRIAANCVRRGNKFQADKEYESALGAYNEAIEWHSLAEAFCNRSGVFIERAEFDRVIEDCNRAIDLKPDLAPAFCNRGTAYLEKGNTNRAIQEYGKTIALNPNYALAFSNRGFAFLLSRKFDLAVEDCNRAVELKPELALAFANRGAAEFCRRRFVDAANDFTECVRLEPQNRDNFLWLYLANARNGQGDVQDLLRQAVNSNSRKWPAPIVEFLLGSSTPETLLAACSHENAHKQRKQVCSAHFFAGQKHLLTGDLQQAAGFFDRAIKTEASTCAEFVVALEELAYIKPVA